MLHKNLIKLIFLPLVIALCSAPLQASDDSDDDGLFERLMDKLEHKKNVAEFEDAEIILEQNFTDGDVEVVIFAKGGDTGMKRFWLFAPNGKAVYQFRAPKNNGNIGGREIVIESPEPPDTSIVLDAYPEGSYTFVAKTFDNEWLLNQADLSHALPDSVDIQGLVADSDPGVAISGFTVTWSTASATHEKFIIELVNESSDLEEELLVDIPADRRTFQAPEEWMVSGSEYQVVVGIVNEFGNKTFVEQIVEVY